VDCLLEPRSQIFLLKARQDFDIMIDKPKSMLHLVLLRAGALSGGEDPTTLSSQLAIPC